MKTYQGNLQDAEEESDGKMFHSVTVQLRCSNVQSHFLLTVSIQRQTVFGIIIPLVKALWALSLQSCAKTVV